MNGKRIAAVGIACGIFIFSLYANKVVGQFTSKRSSQSENTIYQQLFDNSLIEEQIVTQGDSDQKIVFLTINGSILENKETVSVHSFDYQLLMDSLTTIQRDESVKGIVLAIDSPGGGAYESNEIKNKLNELTKQMNIPVYVSLGSMATSGGYYIAANADKIFASTETITGGFTVQLGTEKEDKNKQELTSQALKRFVDTISTGRENLKPEEAAKLADGRLFDGEQAKALGLVDELGSQENAIRALKVDYRLENASVVTYVVREEQPLGNVRDNLLAFLTGEAVEKTNTSTLPSATEQSEGLRIMYLYGGE